MRHDGLWVVLEQLLQTLIGDRITKSNYYLHDLNDVTEQSIIEEKSIKVTCFVQFENIDPNICFVKSDDSYQGTT